MGLREPRDEDLGAAVERRLATPSAPALVKDTLVEVLVETHFFGPPFFCFGHPNLDACMRVCVVVRDHTAA